MVHHVSYRHSDGGNERVGVLTWLPVEIVLPDSAEVVHGEQCSLGVDEKLLHELPLPGLVGDAVLTEYHLKKNVIANVTNDAKNQRALKARIYTQFSCCFSARKSDLELRSLQRFSETNCDVEGEQEAANGANWRPTMRGFGSGTVAKNYRWNHIMSSSWQVVEDEHFFLSGSSEWPSIHVRAARSLQNQPDRIPIVKSHSRPHPDHHQFKKVRAWNHFFTKPTSNSFTNFRSRGSSPLARYSSSPNIT